MTFTQRVVSITQDTILPKVIDNILNDNFMTFRYLGNGKKWSGETLKRPIKIVKNSNGASFQGLDTLSTASVESRITMSYDLRFYSIPVSLPGGEIAVNGVNETQVLSLIKTELESSQADALDDLGTMFYADGTGNSNKDFLGLDALDDDSTSVVTVGGQSRTTYTALKGTRTASGGTMTLAKLATLSSNVAGGSNMNQRPSVIVSSESEFDLYDSLLAPTQRANYDISGNIPGSNAKYPQNDRMMRGGAGFTSLVYRGIPWFADEKAPTQTVWMLNERYLEWYGLNDPNLQKISVNQGTNVDGTYSDDNANNAGFNWTGFMKPVNQYGQVGHIILAGNFTTFQPRRHGRLTGVTTV